MADPAPRSNDQARGSDIKALLDRIDAPDLAYYEFDRGGEAAPAPDKKLGREAASAPSVGSTAALDTRAFPAPEVSVRSDPPSREGAVNAEPEPVEPPDPADPHSEPDLPKLQTRPAPEPPPPPPPQASPPAPQTVATPEPLPSRAKIPMPRPPVRSRQETPADAEESEQRLRDLFQRL